jgi:hypothetical protein
LPGKAAFWADLMISPRATGHSINVKARSNAWVSFRLAKFSLRGSKRGLRHSRRSTKFGLDISRAQQVAPSESLPNFSEQINNIRFQWLSAAHFDQINPTLYGARRKQKAPAELSPVTRAGVGCAPAGSFAIQAERLAGVDGRTSNRPQMKSPSQLTGPAGAKSVCAE